jgi:hypothetical protein
VSGFINRTAGFDAQMLRSYTDIRPPLDNWGPVWSRDTNSPWANGVLWPNSASFGNNTGYFGGGTEYPRWGAPDEEGGGQNMKKFVGLTRDSTGVILGTAVVQGFVTSNDKFIREVISDAGGYFELCSEYSATNHYLVAYKAGSPDQAGTTVNTLQPS